MKRAYLVVGLGFGNEGKAATVDALVRHREADLVLRWSGGSQPGHVVQLPEGRRHACRQFGAGTLAGVRTFLGPQVVLDLPALWQEEQQLQELGIPAPLDLLSIHPDCLVVTVAHQILHRFRDLRLGRRSSTSGWGLGETRRYWLRYGEDAVFVRDLRYQDRLVRKLELLRQRVLEEVSDLCPARQPPREEELDCIQACHRFEALDQARLLRALGVDLRLRATLPPWHCLVGEGAAGVLLDERLGFHPHTTWSTLTPQPAQRFVAGAACTVIGVLRTYLTRQGPGPLPTFDAALTARVADGSVRCGWLDLVLLQYALRVCPVQGLAVNGWDQAQNLQLCETYAKPHYRVEFREGLPKPWTQAEQEALTQLLADEYLRPCSWHVDPDVLRAVLGEWAPLVVEGAGPTWRERTFPAVGVL